eukprot:3527353-Amphidinium_carterae.1
MGGKGGKLTRPAPSPPLPQETWMKEAWYATQQARVREWWAKWAMKEAKKWELVAAANAERAQTIQGEAMLAAWRAVPQYRRLKANKALAEARRLISSVQLPDSVEDKNEKALLRTILQSGSEKKELGKHCSVFDS